ncbi:putative quinol monooxygenase [uncultured Ferrimonas sp.]|uniref:putative quinol monooxygenase n=1 Tax=uncultured Ferrimonas sp. TaxID=432640 RepID=UPI002611F68F|nr:putative quinol monooxygenase [uncultured Ferrimonas sp.]
MSKLTIVAHIIAKPDHIELVQAELIKLVAPTRAEAGCLQYDLHQDNDDPSHFMFYENWTSRALWQQHMGAAHIRAYSQAVAGAVDNFILHEMTHSA